MSLKPIKVWGVTGPNPPKVVMICKELNIPWEEVETKFSEVKTPEFLAVNPNGRLPAIYDPNTDLTLWESGAIVQYLVETYDKDNKISYPKGSKESFLCQQWLFFQVSGQGPYFGQAVWFTKYHPEQVPSAQERYKNEVHRVTGVLESHLSKQPSKVLVGDKITYADISMVMWQHMIAFAMGNDYIDYSKFPTVRAWLDNLLERPSIKEAIEIAVEAFKRP